MLQGESAPGTLRDGTLLTAIMWSLTGIFVVYSMHIRLHCSRTSVSICTQPNAVSWTTTLLSSRLLKC